jgi:hypothetical protein
MNARECTKELGLSMVSHYRAMALIAEVTTDNGWSEDELTFHVNDSRTEVGVRPSAAAQIELYISSSRIMARPGIAPEWPEWQAKTRDGWTLGEVR